MSAIKSCLLAPNESIDFSSSKLRWPLMGSVKFDGVRCLIVRGQLLTRNMKPHKNKNLPEHLRRLVSWSLERDLVLDMELYDHTAAHFAAHTSILAAHDKPIPETMHAYVFDMMPMGAWLDPAAQHPYRQRYLALRSFMPEDAVTKLVEHVDLETPADAKMAFECAVEDGFEGLMLRCPDGRYKHGRATLGEHIIFKFKPFETLDGKIIEVVQRRRLREEAKNAADRKLTPTGNLERIHTKDSYELDDMVGAFKIQFEDGTISEVNYGRGFDHDQRRQHWADRESLVGKWVEVRHLPHGAKDGIRIGTLVRFRPDRD